MHFRLRHIIVIAVSVALISESTLSTHAANGRYGTYYSDPFYYEIENGSITITDFNPFSAYMPIPSTIDGYSVTIIADKALYGWHNEDSTTVIPEGVQVIEDRAFLGVVGHGFNDVLIPKSVVEIGNFAIGYTDYAESLTFDVDEVIGALENVIIRGYTGTAAETYANENGFTFIALDDQTTTTEVSTATTTTTTESQTFTTTTPSTLCGDINLDGVIDISDAVLLQKYAAEMVDLNQQQQLNGDCNADGSTDSQDALSLLRFLVRLTDVLPDVIAN